MAGALLFMGSVVIWCARDGCLKVPSTGFSHSHGSKITALMSSPSTQLRRFFDYLQQQADHAADPVTSFRFHSRYVFYHLLYACGLRVSEGRPPHHGGLLAPGSAPCLFSPRSSTRIA